MGKGGMRGSSCNQDERWKECEGEKKTYSLRKKGKKRRGKACKWGRKGGYHEISIGIKNQRRIWRNPGRGWKCRGRGKKDTAKGEKVLGREKRQIEEYFYINSLRMAKKGGALS